MENGSALRLLGRLKAAIGADALAGARRAGHFGIVVALMLVVAIVCFALRESDPS